MIAELVDFIVTLLLIFPSNSTTDRTTKIHNCAQSQPSSLVKIEEMSRLIPHYLEMASQKPREEQATWQIPEARGTPHINSMYFR